MTYEYVLLWLCCSAPTPRSLMQPAMMHRNGLHCDSNIAEETLKERRRREVRDKSRIRAKVP